MNALEESPPTCSATSPNERRTAALAGVLLGTAVGDALGLPMEGLSARRQRTLFPPPLRHRLIGRWGLVSDDTEHTMMVAQALLSHPGDATAFQRNLAKQFRWWLAGVPAGVGFATLRAILKLWLGVSPKRSGVPSAGNGAAMRSAVIGVFFAHDVSARRAYVESSTAITHRDPRALTAAQAIAETAAWMVAGTGDIDALLLTWSELGTDEEWASLIATVRECRARGDSTAALAQSIDSGAGVSGYAYRSVPVALYAALRHRGDFSQALQEAIACGGDTDTVGAMTGALVGANLGPAAIPEAWIDGIRDYPLSMNLLRRIANRLAQHADGVPLLGPVSYPRLLPPLRNLVFLGIVLFHGFRRIFPPY